MRRYREFVWLRTQFKLDSANKIRKVPDLPPKAILKSFTDTKFNNERLKGLESFLKEICAEEAFQDENRTPAWKCRTPIDQLPLLALGSALIRFFSLSHTNHGCLCPCPQFFISF